MVRFISFLSFSLIFFSSILAQTSIKSCIPFGHEISKNYQNCAAIFFNDQLLVDDFSPMGNCKLERDQKGEIRVSTVRLDENGAEKITEIPFRVAIKNVETNTLFLYNKEDVKSVRYEDVLKACETNDQLIILTSSQVYNLSHHTIQINWGC